MTEIKGNSADVNIEAMKRVYFPENLLDAAQTANVRHLENSMDKFKIFNPYARIAILGVVGKECNFKVGSEVSYKNTPNDRIRMIFGSRLANYNDAQLTALKKDDYDFFNAVYGGMYQNDTTEGFKYRGRGFNQITFKANYDTIAKIIGVDIVANPDLMMDAKIAADATIAYFVNRWKSKPVDVPQLADLRNINDATLFLFRANAGWNKNIDTTFHKQTLDKVRNWSKNFTYIN